jgi:hypothetical protein
VSISNLIREGGREGEGGRGEGGGEGRQRRQRRSNKGGHITGPKNNCHWTQKKPSLDQVEIPRRLISFVLVVSRMSLATSLTMKEGGRGAEGEEGEGGGETKEQQKEDMFVLVVSKMSLATSLTMICTRRWGREEERSRRRTKRRQGGREKK